MVRNLLGLTIACARCHDHKYDAVGTDDYYALYGVFASCYEPREKPLIADPALTPGYDSFKPGYEQRFSQFDGFVTTTLERIITTAREWTTDYLVQVVTNPPEKLLGEASFISLLDDELKPRITQQWRDYLEQCGPQDPVFGPWHSLLSNDGDATFAARVAACIPKLAEQSGSAVNPFIKQALLKVPPQQPSEVAEVYGQVFAEVYRKHSGSSQSKTDISPSERPLWEILFGDSSPIHVPRDDFFAYLARSEWDRFLALRHELRKYEVHTPGAPPRAMALCDKQTPYDPQVFVRGNPLRHGKPVARRFLRLLAGEQPEEFRGCSGRLQLAKAIISPTNPLTARVIVNRVWMHHLGQPLVSTPSDFGVRSSPPSHPQLLDHLAAQLQQHDWSLKWLHRRIMLSATYRQASNDRPECLAVDPENRLLWRVNRRRLELEPMRDALLAVAGRLDAAIGGRPAEMVDPPFSRRRMVYGYVDRQDLPKLFRNFDFANPDQSIARRSSTTVPQQSLFMMNAPFVIEQAGHLAARAEVRGQSTIEAKVAALYRIVFAREPTASEQQIGERFIASASEQPHGAKLSPLAQYAQLLLMTNEFVYVD